MPIDRRSRKKWSVLSIALHILIILWLIRPEGFDKVNPNLVLAPPVGGGGEGPLGGGGGGTRGSGAVRYIPLVVPPRPAVVPPAVAPPEIKQQVPEPVKPVIPEIELPKIEASKVSVDAPKPEVAASSQVVGTGGGSGSDGTSGSGSGTGGGVGSGTGTGRGSGTGPGTGGALGPPQPSLIEMPIPPLPTPDKVKGTHFEANFYVSATGKVDSIVVKRPTKDGGYNAKLRDLFKTFRFRPAMLDGKPVAGVYPYSYVF